MKTDQSHHLKYSDQLKAIVDQTDLTDRQRDHLKGCQSCQHQVARLEQRYTRLGETARALAPEPRRPFRLPRGAAFSGGRRFGTIWATGLVALMLFIFMVWWPQRFPSEQDARQFSAQGVENDRQLMVEVNALIENALPESLREVAAVLEPPLDLDEDLINWIVPSIEEDNSLT